MSRVRLIIAAALIGLVDTACSPATTEPETVVERVTERLVVPDPSLSEIQEEVERRNAAAERALREQERQIRVLDRQARRAQCIAEGRAKATRDDGTIDPGRGIHIEMGCDRRLGGAY